MEIALNSKNRVSGGLDEVRSHCKPFPSIGVIDNSRCPGKQNKEILVILEMYLKVEETPERIA